MSSQRFRAVLRLPGQTATGISVPATVVEALGADHRAASRVAAGDELDVELERDDETRG